MSWYKKSHFELSDLNDRGIVNEKIHYFEELLKRLDKISKGVFQNARDVKGINQEILNHKKLSSHPLIKDILIDADKIVLDNPWKFAEYCDIAKLKIEQQIDILKKERTKFVEKTLPDRMKGFADGK